MESQNTNDSELSSSQPKLINIPLFLHQLKSVEKMTTSENTQIIETGGLNYINTKLGVLADLPGYGKCLKRDTPIVLYSGEIEFVQNIKVGTLLMGDDSTPRTVLSISRGIGEMFKIKQKDGGEDYIVNSEHILSMKMSVSKFIKKSNMGVQVFFFVPEKVNWHLKSFSYAKYSSKEEANEKAQCFLDDLVINPYIDIELSKYMKLSKDLKSKLLGYRVGVEFQEKKVDIDPYFMGLLIGDDTIPFDYKVNSRLNRLKLLRGLMDSNKVFQKNNMLANDIVFLCRSLGFRTTVENDIISFSHKDLCCEIGIEPVGIDNYYGFTLDGNHRYLHGDFTVSHNSLSLLGLIANSQSVLNESEEKTVYSIKLIVFISFNGRWQSLKN